MKFKMWMGIATAVGLGSLSLAMGAVPQARSVVTDDTAIYQHLSEIQVSREARPNFDGDIARLSAIEPAYREKLPTLSRDPRLASAMKRIAGKSYRYSGRPSSKKNVATN
jgi:hypothetical protein